ncbi:MAG: lyase family protein, partial [bacterium]
MQSLRSISPIDGRYRKTVEELSQFFSEEALIRYRIIVEGEYLIALSDEKKVGLRKFNDKERNIIRDLYNIETKDAFEVKLFEATTNHDVKAVEYFLKERLSRTSLKDSIEWIHFALTSEDTNNIAYSLMLAEAQKRSIIPVLDLVLDEIESMALQYKNVPMLARTHGQSASPTTLGKEFKVFSSRLKKQVDQLKKHRIGAKLNGATGNYNAHFVAYPDINWRNFTKNFIKRLCDERGVDLEPSLVTTQIESHDTYAEIFDLMRRINTI